METKKATLKVNGNHYQVNYLGFWVEGTCRVSLDWDNPVMGLSQFSQKLLFDQFIEDIGFPHNRWNYKKDSHAVFYVPSYGITMVESEEAEATLPVRDPKHNHWKLTGIASRKLEEFAEEGYLIVRVEDSLDMGEGTITIHYKKEEAK